MHILFKSFADDSSKFIVLHNALVGAIPILLMLFYVPNWNYKLSVMYLVTIEYGMWCNKLLSYKNVNENPTEKINSQTVTRLIN